MARAAYLGIAIATMVGLASLSQGCDQEEVTPPDSGVGAAAAPTAVPTLTPLPDDGFDKSTPAPTLCPTVTFRGVTKCLPEGARFGAVAPLGGLPFSYVERGQSFFRYSEGELLDWHVAAEDEADFAELKVLFLRK